MRFFSRLIGKVLIVSVIAGISVIIKNFQTWGKIVLICIFCLLVVGFIIFVINEFSNKKDQELINTINKQDEDNNTKLE